MALQNYDWYNTVDDEGTTRGHKIGRGLGSALVDGVDSAYDTVRDKLRGKEPDVIAAITIGFLSILTVRYLYKAVGRGPAGSD